MNITPLNTTDYDHIVFFTGAGMSAESGVPTYRGSGGIWHEYRWEDYASQEAWKRNPDKVFDFHDERRKEALKCNPHAGHEVIALLEQDHPDVISSNTKYRTVCTSDPAPERSPNCTAAIWRIRCEEEGSYS